MKRTPNGLEVVEIENKFYALNGWNGSEWNDCFEVDEIGLTIDGDSDAIRIQPILQQVDEDNWEEVGYEILY